jgi:hypothetical protein
MMAAILSVAVPVQRVKHLLGDPPEPRLSPAQKAAIAQEIDLLRTRGEGDARVFLHVIAHRTPSPAELFLAAADLDLGAASDEGRLLALHQRSLVLESADERQVALDGLLAADPEIDQAVEAFEAAAGAVSAAFKLGDRIGPEFRAEVSRRREALESLLGARLIPSARAAVDRVWGAGSHEISAAAVLAAEDAARAIVKLSRLAALIAAERLVRGAVGAVLDRALAACAECRDATRVVNAARLVEIVAGSDRAAQLLRDHKAVLARAWSTPPRAAR